MKWLVTAFAPFAGASVNASQTVLKALGARDNFEFFSPVPVTFKDAWPATHARLAGFGGVLGLGQADGRHRVSLEVVAINRVDTTTADNAGVTPALGPVIPGDIAARFSPIPWPRFDHPACERSYSAGTFVCNAWMYQALAWAERHGKYAGFIHVPNFDDAAPREAVAIEALERVLDFLREL